MSEVPRVIVTCDSTCDLSPALRERYGILVNPLYVIMGERTCKDGVDANPQDIYDYYGQTGKLAKSAAANLQDCIDFFKPLSAQADAVLHITISSEMSANFNNAAMAAKQFENVYVIDGRNLSTGGGLLVVEAAERAAQGVPAQQIVRQIEEMRSRVDASFIIDNLEYLYKGGRCSGVAALGANLLKLKPCIEVRHGKMTVGKKYRGKFNAVLLEYARERLQNADDIVPDRVFVTHAGCSEEIVDQVAGCVRQTGLFREVFVTRAGCTISAHCGANTLGVLFVRKTPLQ